MTRIFGACYELSELSGSAARRDDAVVPTPQHVTKCTREYARLKAHVSGMHAGFESSYMEEAST